jgi:polyhydroxyalkanoate synthesis repressor PhaR
MVVKKYGNRRLYDTEASRYVTLEEVEARVRRGDDVEVVDAKTGRDLTQSTLAQIILESRGAARLLPVPLLRQLIRMGDDALAEFFERTVIWALDIYLLAKKGARVFPISPLGALPFLNAMLGGGTSRTPWAPSREPDAEDLAASPDVISSDVRGPGAGLPSAERDEQAEELAALRRELDELKRIVGKKRREP